MLQRNATNYPLVLPTLNPPVEVPPGWELEHPTPLAGFEPARPTPQRHDLAGPDAAEPDAEPLEVPAP